MMPATTIGLDEIDRLTEGKTGRLDVPCPLCGPDRRSPANQRRPVLRVWRLSHAFASYHCARCGEKGFARGPYSTPIDPGKLAKVRAEAAQREQEAAGERIRKARWLWARRKPISGTIAETYLRVARAFGGRLQATLGFMPGSEKHSPAMIAAFGIALEPEPGMLAIKDDAVCAVHITRLTPDGLSKAGTSSDKIMLGRPRGAAIILAPPNNLSSLVISEGIEDALSAHEVTGCGAWAAGAASFMPALADVVPDYIESVTILVDGDNAGRRSSQDLAARLKAKSCEVNLVELTQRAA